jgi:hypothetical protein
MALKVKRSITQKKTIEHYKGQFSIIKKNYCLLLLEFKMICKTSGDTSIAL